MNITCDRPDRTKKPKAYLKAPHADFLQALLHRPQTGTPNIDHLVTLAAITQLHQTAHRWLPQQITPDLLQEPIRRETINTFIEQWSENYFPLNHGCLLEPDQETFAPAAIENIMSQIPIEPYGWNTEDEIFEYGVNPQDLLYIFTAEDQPEFLDGLFQETMEEFLNLPEHQLPPRPHLDLTDLPQALQNTRFRNLTLLLDYFSAATDNIFLDTNDGFNQHNLSLPWEDQVINQLIAEWKEAKELIPKLYNEINDFNDDPTDYTICLIDTLNGFARNNPQSRPNQP